MARRFKWPLDAGEVEAIDLEQNTVISVSLTETTPSAHPPAETPPAGPRRSLDFAPSSVPPRDPLPDPPFIGAAAPPAPAASFDFVPPLVPPRDPLFDPPFIGAPALPEPPRRSLDFAPSSVPPRDPLPDPPFIPEAAPPPPTPAWHDRLAELFPPRQPPPRPLESRAAEPVARAPEPVREPERTPEAALEREPVAAPAPTVADERTAPPVVPPPLTQMRPPRVARFALPRPLAYWLASPRVIQLAVPALMVIVGVEYAWLARALSRMPPVSVQPVAPPLRVARPTPPPIAAAKPTTSSRAKPAPSPSRRAPSSAAPVAPIPVAAAPVVAAPPAVEFPPAPDVVDPNGSVSIPLPIPVHIFERGLFIGTNDDAVSLPPGGHDLEIENRSLSYRQTMHVEIGAGQRATVRVALPAGVLSVASTPASEVFIDGVRQGRTPLELVPVTIGTHQLLLRTAQLPDATRQIMVTLEAPLRLTVDLRP